LNAYRRGPSYVEEEKTMNRGRTALLLAAAGVMLIAYDDTASAQRPTLTPQPRPTSAPTITRPSSTVTVDLDATTIHTSLKNDVRLSPGANPAFLGGWLTLSGTATAATADGTPPAVGTRIQIVVDGDVEGLTTCFTAANQARLAGGKHTLRVSVAALVGGFPADRGDIQVPIKNITCEIDP
jgi:hypothetical protein